MPAKVSSPADKAAAKGKKRARSKSPAPNAPSTSAALTGGVGAQSTKPPPSGWIVSCDIPLKQFILKLNDDKTSDKKFVLEDLDETHLLIDGRIRGELAQKIEEFMDENVWSSSERVGENLGLD